MASKSFLSRIQKAAKFLGSSSAQGARGYLDKPLESALKVIDCFSDGKQHTYSEIAEATGLNAQTVAQIISALEAGGYPIQFVYDAVQRRGEIGRKPALVRKKVKNKSR